ncbi:MAG: M56 family metallopeptidase [Oscillospiraceae bacterium]|jgi:beta-lactamase regulating signal transducer with metallopeptidase domain|nr:M56 family metallopeptidase [Oscillospiraceae bacterium]
MIEWIVTSSALILLVLLLRLLVRDRVSPRLRYALWGLVLLRLVIPVSLWESPASVLRAAQINEGYQLVSTLPNNMSLYENGNWRSVAGPDGTFQMEPDAAGRWEVNQPRLHNAYGWVAVPSAEEARALRDRGQKAVDTAGLKRLVDVQNVLRMVWQTGIWLFMLFLAAVNGKFALDLRRGRRPDGEYRGRPVFILDSLPTPCLFGLFRPAIYLTPEVAADETCRKHVLAHECAHFRQGDHAWAVWRGVCLALHWYNPLVWLAAYLSRRDCELSCDEGAVRLLGEENRVDYGRTLVGLVARRTTPRDLACCATTMTGGKSALKERIALLVKHPRTTAVTAVLVAAACAVFAACTFTGAAEAEEPAEPSAPAQAEPAQPESQPPEAPSLPALEDLPTRIVSQGTPEAEADIWLVAELPEDDIAAYFEPDTAHSWLRYGEFLQELVFDDRNKMLMTPRKQLPELYFEDLDGDGEKELAIIYNSDTGTGVSVWSLTVLEWDGESWTAHTAHLEKDIIREFRDGYSLDYYGVDENYVTVGFRGHSARVDMAAMFGGSTVWKEEPLYVELTGMISAYSMRSHGLTLTLAGELRPASYEPTSSYGFEYSCNVYYEADGTFRSMGDYLSTEYQWTPRADESLLTPIFRNILREFIHQCRAEGTENLSSENFAICDVNGDGKNELIIQRNSTYVAGQVERVYSANGNELLAEYPMTTYYDNGYVTAGWSHNQGVAGDKLWPYTLYRYDGSAGKYVREAAVDGWDKSIRDTYLSYDETTIPFPEDVDKDGDGFVYYIIEEEGGYAPVYGEPMDYADYALWVARYLGTNRVDVTYYPLTEKNIALIERN